MGTHVLQQPLLLDTTLLAVITQATEPYEDLKSKHTSIIDMLQNKKIRITWKQRHKAHLFDNVIVVCFHAVNFRFFVSILDWAQSSLLARDMHEEKNLI